MDGPGRSFESRQPTNRTNFCGAGKLPLSAHCCNIARQILGRSVFRGVDLPIRGSEPASPPAKPFWPGLRVGVLLPTSKQPLPPPAILFYSNFIDTRRPG